MSTRSQVIPPIKQAAATQALYAAAEQFGGVHPAITFIDELLTESEKVTLGRRILIAQLIVSGYNYNEVNEQIKISPNTYAKTRRWLQQKLPNYAEVLKEYEDQTKRHRAEKKPGIKKYDPFTFKGMRSRYPMHFLFFNVAEELLKKLRS